MKSITALQGQSIFDIAIQYCGSVDASYAIAKANGLTLDATLLPGQIVLVPEVIDRRIVEELRRRGVGVASRWVLAGEPPPPPLYNDWYLPSKNEIEAIYAELHNGGLIDMNNIYWSSSEYNSDYSYYFSYGLSSYDRKTDPWVIKPIRDFISTEVYALRDFEGGGWIFYIEDLGGGNYKYYVAPPNDNDSITSLQWGASGHTVGGTGTTIGAGKSNTATIVAALEALNQTGKAAQYCNDLIIAP